MEQITTKDISDEAARKVLRAATEKSREIDCKMDIAVVDAGSNLKTFFRKAPGWEVSISLSKKPKPPATSICQREKLANSVNPAALSITLNILMVD